MTHITDWIQKHIGIGGVLAFAIFAQLIGVIFVSILPLAVCGENTAEAVKTVVAKGDAAAQFRYVEMLRTGNGVVTNIADVVIWMRKAAESGYIEAQLRYGEMLRDGRGVAKNMKEAAMWTRKALSKKRNEDGWGDKSYMSIVGYDEKNSNRVRNAFVMPFYDTNGEIDYNLWSGCEGFSSGVFQLCLGTFTPEELKSVGELKIKVGHMKRDQFSE